jgi:HEAT repeat protein
VTEPATKPRTWRPMAAWTAGILLALGLVGLIWFRNTSPGQAPATSMTASGHTSQVLDRFQAHLESRGSMWSILSVDEPFKEKSSFLRFLGDAGCLDELGGPEKAALELQRYLQAATFCAPRKKGAAMLLCFCDGAGLPAMQSALRHEDEDVRLYAVVGIGWTRKRLDEACILDLIRALNDPSGTVRQAAAGALGYIGPAASPAVPILEKRARTSVAAVKALRRISGTGASDTLRDALQEGSNAFVIQSAADALAGMGESSVPALIEALRGRQAHTRMSAARALGAIRDQRAVNPLTAVLDDPDEYVRAAAAEALKKIRGEEAKP